MHLSIVEHEKRIEQKHYKANPIAHFYLGADSITWNTSITFNIDKESHLFKDSNPTVGPFDCKRRAETVTQKIYGCISQGDK